MTRNQPSQGRSRDRVERILLAATELIAESGSADALTTTAVAFRANMSVATIYRYFEDRHEIFRALLEREIARLDAAMNEAIAALESVTLESLIEVFVSTHYDYFESDRTVVILWHETREGKAVADMVTSHYRALGDWITVGAMRAGLVREDAPSWAVETVIWLCDQTFKLVFREDSEPADRIEVVVGVKQMIRDQVFKYATPKGLNGIAPNTFFAAAGRCGESSVEGDR